MGHNQAIHPGVQGLFDDPLVALAGVWRNPDKGHYSGLKGGLGDDLLAVQQKLERATQARQVKTLVLHLKNNKIIAEIGVRHSFVNITGPDHASAKHHLTSLKQLNNLVQTARHGTLLFSVDTRRSLPKPPSVYPWKECQVKAHVWTPGGGRCMMVAC